MKLGRGDIIMHSAVVVEPHEDGGGRLTLKAETYLDEHEFGPVKPLYTGLYTIPAADAEVSLWEFPGGRLAWVPMAGTTATPAWLDADPTRVGFQNRPGTLQAIIDDTLVRLGSVTASDAATMWPALKIILLDILNALSQSATHVHTGVTTGAGTSGPPPIAPAPGSWVLPTQADTDTNADTPAATKVTLE